MNLREGKYYWVRFYRDNAEWEPAQFCYTSTDGCQNWRRINSEEEWYGTEVNQIGPEIVPPVDDLEAIDAHI